MLGWEKMASSCAQGSLDSLFRIWNRLPRDGSEPTALEVFKRQVDVALRDMLFFSW